MLNDPPPDDGLQFAERSFRPRLVGLALGALVLGAVFTERPAAGWVWLAIALHVFAWPPLALWLARRSRCPRAAERRNLLADHALGGLWTAAMGFNLLPAVLGLGLMAMNSVAGGGSRLLAIGIAVHAAGALCGALLTGFDWQPTTSQAVLIAAIPVLIVQPLMVGYRAMSALARLKRKHLELEQTSRRDGLSGLVNRAHWETLVATEFERFRRTGAVATLVMADLDHFKRINDEYGHAAGDAVIAGFAAVLRRELRAIDVPGRYGGEEFGILMPGTGAPAAREAVERLRRCLHATPLLEGRPVTASFGIAQLSPGVERFEDWIRQADQMLYRAKHRGRDRLAAPGDETLQGLRLADLQPGGATAFADLPRGSLSLARLLSGLDRSGDGYALLDPVDRIVAANPAFAALLGVPAGLAGYADVMHAAHRHGSGPCAPGEEPDAWLQAADARRRSRPRRDETLQLADGRVLVASETTLNDGWLLLRLHEPGREPLAGVAPSHEQAA